MRVNESSQGVGGVSSPEPAKLRLHGLSTIHRNLTHVHGWAVSDCEYADLMGLARRRLASRADESGS